MGGGGKNANFFPIFCKLFPFNFLLNTSKKWLGITIYWPRTQTAQLMYSDKSVKIMKKVLLIFSISSMCTSNKWNFETDVIKRRAHIILLRCIFLVIETAKKKEKGCSKMVIR